tara:strand:- start:147 stop:911 length:765 start_codon:yes stop_codon:yes gene_type:complete
MEERMSKEKSSSELSVWEDLSKKDLSKRIETKDYQTKSGKPYSLKYISWAWAWGEVKKSYPDASYEVHDNITYHDNTVEVRVSVTIKGQTHMMWLPVMDYKNDAKKNPTSKDISDSRMRCFAKAIAMHGLGHYVYAGEDLPEGNAEAPQSEEKTEEVVDPTQEATPTPPPPTEATPDVVSAENGEVKKTEDWTMVTDAFSQLIDVHKTSKTLKDFWLKNEKARMLLKENRPNDYKEIYDKIQKRTAELKEKANG